METCWTGVTGEDAAREISRAGKARETDQRRKGSQMKRRSVRVSFGFIYWYW